jgi:hypothetical protein
LDETEIFPDKIWAQIIFAKTGISFQETGYYLNKKL